MTIAELFVTLYLLTAMTAVAGLGALVAIGLSILQRRREVRRMHRMRQG